MRANAVLVALLWIGGAVACGPSEPAAEPAPVADRPGEPRPEPAPERGEPPVPPTPVLHEPVPLYEGGQVVRTVDAAVERDLLRLDLGDAWTPYLFTEADSPDGTPMPHPYRATYLALARGDFPDDYHGQRAREDVYLELYGIPPTVTLMRSRMEHVEGLGCAERLDLAPLASFDGYIGYEDSNRAQAQARRLAQGERIAARLLEARPGTPLAALSAEGLSRPEADQLREWQRNSSRFLVVAAIQERLTCEGFFAGKGRHVRGALDWATHEAIAEFERRHRLLGWGNVSRETLAALRKTPLELERETVIRVLTERAMHDAGVIEDGSAERSCGAVTASCEGGAAGLPNLERSLRERIVSSFALETPQSTLAFLRSLETIGDRRIVGVRDVARPAYHSSDMDLRVEIDRGDVWYEFPYDEQGREQAQGVSNRPSLTLFVRHEGRDIPLVRYGTTIGGWRTEYVGEQVMWAYKESPPGPVLWEKIVAAPVWLPPESTPPRSLLTRTARGWAPNQHEVGPSYASAYGLVVAYHRPYVRDAAGNMTPRGDQGIRTHGSVDYMSIARRHSHGCHRLHNHVAVRMMSFVLRHRAHQRRGEASVAYGRNIVHEGRTYTLRVDQGGYEFVLARPIPVEVLPGRILGERTLPIATPLPRFDSTIGAYLLPDGGAARVDTLGNVTPIPWPLDAGVPVDAGAAVDAGVHRDAAAPHVGASAPHPGASPVHPPTEPPPGGAAEQ